MFRVASISALVVIFMSAGAVQAQYYTTHYDQTTATYQPAKTVYYASAAAADPSCGVAATAAIHTMAYYVPTATYYAAKTTAAYYAPRPQFILITGGGDADKLKRKR
jgi:hypothetical protein